MNSNTLQNGSANSQNFFDSELSNTGGSVSTIRFMQTFLILIRNDQSNLYIHL